MSKQPPNYIPDDQLLGMLRSFHEKTGRTPTDNECTRANGLPSATTLKLRFGSYNESILHAGLPTNSDGFHSENVWSDEELLAHIQMLARELGYVPLPSDARYRAMRGRVASMQTFIRRFGSWSSALDRAGIKHSRAKLWMRSAVSRIHRWASVLSKSLREEVSL